MARSPTSSRFRNGIKEFLKQEMCKREKGGAGSVQSRGCWEQRRNARKGQIQYWSLVGTNKSHVTWGRMLDVAVGKCSTDWEVRSETNFVA